MRYPSDHKQKTRERVVHSAARELRRHGPEKLGVADVMKGAGLTHGGFYAHFASKDELVVAAIEDMFRDAVASFERTTAGKPPRQGIADYVDRYLTLTHCDARGSGCPIAALATDVPRMEATARRAFEQGAAHLASAIAGNLREMNVRNAGDVATSMLAELVGTLVLARCASDPQTAQKLLDASRSQLMQRPGA
jgi:TetR/AcrR family transcriptional regulator, transcriptional repressor for nem operon